mmetsp:Transcript_14748/g.35117  ORF Transcript_14748/g.35117 Transcript_14748/m.35117 type:complete len:244 (+) Transcript_14748:910-1641(+)
MYGLWEVQERCDLIISRYQKYETAGEAQRTAAIAANQDFDELHSTITEMVSDLEKRADFLIKNSYSGHGRAAKVAVENTKLRQQKQQAVEACVQLRLMITRGKRLTKETIVRRMGALDQLIEQIGKIPDQIRQGREIFHERLTQAEQLDPGHAVYVVAARADWSQPTSESEKFWEVALASVRGCRRPLSFCCPVWTPPPYPPKESRSRGEAVSVPIPFLVLLEALLCEEGGGKGGMWGRGTEG